MGSPGVHVVEVPGHAEDLMYIMDEVKQWLNDSGVYAPRMEYYWVSETLVFLVTFRTRSEAALFSRSFDGRLLDGQATE